MAGMKKVAKKSMKGVKLGKAMPPAKRPGAKNPSVHKMKAC